MKSHVVIWWLAGALVGCAAAPENHYYRLSAPATDGVAAASPELSDTAVTVDLPAILDRLQVVEGTGPHTVEIREFDRWAAPLDEMVPRVLSEDLAALNAGRRGPRSQRLEVHVDEFIAGADGKIHFNGTWSTLGGQGRRTWRFSLRARADPQQVSTVAASMSSLLEQLAATIARTP